MKVYVIKKNDGGYLSQTGAIIPDLFQANLFFSYKQAEKHCKYLDSEVVECDLIETKELTDYAKQVRKEVCESIREKAELFGVCKTGTIAEEYRISKYVLDQIQGETNGSKN